VDSSRTSDEPSAGEVSTTPSQPPKKRAHSEIDNNAPEMTAELPTEGQMSSQVQSGNIGDDSDEDDERMSDTEADAFPVSHEVVLQDHEKVVSAFAIDNAGARMATASHDYDVKLWDFGGMDARMKPFKSFEPAGNYHVSYRAIYNGLIVGLMPGTIASQIHDVAFSPDNQSLLVISGYTQAKLYTREGEDGVVFPKGDPYIHDMRHTK
jgi:WD40 repeat protein